MTTIDKTARHYARYHTKTIAGAILGDPPKPFMAFSDNPISHLLGAHVWLIERKEDRYFLQAVFIVDEVRDTPPDAEMDLAYQVLGRAGIGLLQVEIGAKPWWSEFFNSIGHGGLGISPVRPEYVKRLQALTSQRLSELGFVAAT